MKKQSLNFILFLIGGASSYIFSVDTRDTIIAIVSSSVGIELITQSDLDRQTLFGNFRTLEECELEKAILLEAIKFQIHVDDAMVEAYLDSVQKAYNITRQEVQQMFIDAGYTVSEGIEQLRNSQIINIMLQREVYEHIAVSVQEAQRYYEENPEYYQATYTVQRASVKSDESNEVDVSALQFSEPVTLQESEIASTHRFILSMEVGQIQSVMIEEDIESVRLLEKTSARIIPFQDRYETIVQILKKEKYTKLFEQYKQKVLQSVTIVRT